MKLIWKILSLLLCVSQCCEIHGGGGLAVDNIKQRIYDEYNKIRRYIMLWNERFAFGIDEIDQQHKVLFDLIERTQGLIVDAEEGIDCYDEIIEVLNELADYTVYHFNYEEDILGKKGYQGLEAHAAEHERFVEKVKEFLATDIDEDHIGVIEEVVSFLLTWVSEHVLTTDTAYISILKV